MSKEAASFAEEACAFLKNAVTPFHVTQSLKESIVSKGFVEINEKTLSSDSLPLCAGGKYVIQRNGSSLAALIVGKKFRSSNGAMIIAAHTDSPTLIMKPQSSIQSQGSQQLGVQCYGGGLWHTWFDRDLSIAGRVALQRKGSSEATNNQSQRLALYSHLVNIKRPVLSIPNLAIHLQTSEEREKLSINKENHLIPIVSTILKKEEANIPSNIPPELSEEILSTLHRDSKEFDIVDHELCLYDTASAQIGGLHREYLHSARLDNLASCFASVKSLLDCTAYIEESDHAHIVILYDNEEIGSQSFCGADGTLLSNIIDLLLETETQHTACRSAAKQAFIANSFCISADCGHAIHPNYADKHENNHKPRMNGGIALKHNASVKYATQSITSAIIRKLANLAEVPLQDIVGRNDKPCGSTVGPIISAKTGIQAVDIGIPLWAMHSIRETCGVQDLYDSSKLFSAFFKHCGDILKEIQICDA